LRAIISAWISSWPVAWAMPIGDTWSLQ
jgi:hypothetical protein